MATTALFLWSSGSSSSTPEAREDGGSPVLAGEAMDPAAARPARSRKAKAARTPQRGLGVAQLEQIRLQECWSKLNGANPAPMLLPQIPARYGAVNLWGEPAALCYRIPSPAPEVVAPNFRSVVYQQYGMDRNREGRVQAATGLVPELPSNQKLTCLSDQCGFCAGKRFLGENPWLNTVDYRMMDLNSAMDIDQERKASVMKTEMKEYDFFPHKQMRSGGGDSVFADQIAAGDNSFVPSNIIDLDLRL